MDKTEGYKELLQLDYEDKEIVIAGLRRLSERQQVVFLAWVVGFTQEETGRVMGIDQSVVSRQLAAAINNMRATDEF